LGQQISSNRERLTLSYHGRRADHAVRGDGVWMTASRAGINAMWPAIIRQQTERIRACSQAKIRTAR
jgi:hypothetical protein